LLLAFGVCLSKALPKKMEIGRLFLLILTSLLLLVAEVVGALLGEAAALVVIGNFPHNHSLLARLIQ
jgi:hypothetical protein